MFKSADVKENMKKHLFLKIEGKEQQKYKQCFKTEMNFVNLVGNLMCVRFFIYFLWILNYIPYYQHLKKQAFYMQINTL